MRVKLLVGYSAPDWSAGPGEVIEASAEEAARLVTAGHAEYVDAPPLEMATVVAPEDATLRSPRRRRGGRS